MALPSFLKDMLTGKDGESHDIARHSWLWTTVGTFAVTAWNAAHAGVVDVEAFARAIGVIVVAHGGAIFAKARTEPDPKDPA